MYQPPAQPPRNQPAKPLLIGCGVLVALFLLIAACGAIFGQSSDVQTTADRAPKSVVADARVSEANGPTPTSTETLSDSPSPTPTGIDAAARRACTANVQAAALRAAGWTEKADAKDSDAELAASESDVITLQLVDSEQVPAWLHDWCTSNLPDVHAKPVAKKPAARPKPKPAKTTTAPSVPSGATAICRDGTYSFSAHRRGTCSHHGGVRTWL